LKSLLFLGGGEDGEGEDNACSGVRPYAILDDDSNNKQESIEPAMKIVPMITSFLVGFIIKKGSSILLLLDILI
jgi:hypothetical protein